MRVGLRIASGPYAAASALRNLAFDRGLRSIQRVPAPVVSVGNLTVGGTGKTPIVEYVARWFRRRHLRVAILSRGYGATSGRNDEALLLEENLPDVPHLQGPDRALVARIACGELESQVLILDDGFQHRRLHRDLDVVLLDATDPFGGGWQLPAGLLRESRNSLARADLIVLTRGDAVEPPTCDRIREQIRDLAADKPVVVTRFVPDRLIRYERPETPIEEARHLKALAFCGVGNPNAFRRTLTDIAANITEFRCYPDHHDYTRADVTDLIAWVRAERPQAILTTQKDLVKICLTDIAGLPLFAVGITTHVVDGAQHLETSLQRIVEASLTQLQP